MPTPQEQALTDHLKKSAARASRRMEIEAAILYLQDNLAGALLYGNDPVQLLPRVIRACLSGTKNKKVRDLLSDFETDLDVLICEETS